MKEVINILIVHNYYQVPGGEDTVVSNEQDLLKEKGHNVWLYSRNNSEISKMNIFHKATLPFLAVFNIRTYFEVKKLIKEKKIDIVHVHNTLSLISPAVYYAAKVCNVPVVQTIHNFRLLCPAATLYRSGSVCEDCIKIGLICALKHKCYRESFSQTGTCVLSTLIHRATKVYGQINYICLTEFNKEKLQELKQISENQIFVKPNFVNTVKTVSNIKRNLKQYIYVGRLDNLKGIKQLFEAWNIIEQNYSGLELQLLVCGTGPLEIWCQDYIKKRKLTSIKMTGFIRNDKVKREIAMSKALILPTQWYEGFPMTIVEAFSVGTPVLGANIGNVGDLIEDEITGLKYDSKNPIEIVNAIVKSQSIEFFQVESYYQEKYTREKNYMQLLSIYRNIMDK